MKKKNEIRRKYVRKNPKPLRVPVAYRFDQKTIDFLREKSDELKITQTNIIIGCLEKQFGVELEKIENLKI